MNVSIHHSYIARDESGCVTVTSCVGGVAHTLAVGTGGAISGESSVVADTWASCLK